MVPGQWAGTRKAAAGLRSPGSSVASLDRGNPVRGSVLLWRGLGGMRVVCGFVVMKQSATPALTNGVDTSDSMYEDHHDKCV
jgi:hypothetical protein